MEHHWAFVSVSEIVSDLGISRQRVHQIIKEQGLGTRKFGNITLINTEDYKFYLKLRKRRDLAFVAGRKEFKLIRTAEYDTVCPTCGSFAVNWDDKIACENDHVFYMKGRNK